MTHDSLIIYSFDFGEDEGLLVRALLTYLLNLHNQVVNACDEQRAYRERAGGEGNAPRSFAIASDKMTQSHIVDLNTDRIQAFIEKYCMSGDNRFDYSRIVSMIVDEQLGHVPGLQSVIRSIVWSNNNREADVHMMLNAHVPQKALPRDLEEAIQRAMTTPAAAFSALKSLNTVVSLLCSGGSSSTSSSSSTSTTTSAVGDITLGTYLREVLLLDEEAVGGSSIAQQVRLCHLASLWTLLRSCTSTDPFKDVLDSFKQPLTEE